MRAKLRCENLVRVGNVARLELEKAFTEEEIWATIQSYDGNRASETDGFNMSFFKEFWAMIKDDIMKVFMDFHEHGKLVKGLNASFIALIPKSPSPSSISDYRPISLIGSIYKLISKVLAIRLQSIMPSILSENQFAFTTGRQISDCILVTNEVVDAMKKNRQGGILLKLDFAKAYDNMDWCFLMDLLQEMGFGGRWIKWMEECVSTASLVILVNGSPTDFFKIEKGLRQGNPLSPLLFNICVNGLSGMMNQLLSLLNPCRYHIGGSLFINHLQFVDDTLIFCQNDDEHIKNIGAIMEMFLAISGLKVNYSKSLLMGCNVDMV